jgi:hypothetical protein
MRAVLATLIFCLVATLSLPAAARTQRHPVHPMVQGLGIGLAYMLSHKDHRSYYAGPAAMPVYGYQEAQPRRSASRPPRVREFASVQEPVRQVARFVGRVVGDIGQIVSHPAGCPHTEFCGCGASLRIFGKPVRELFLAANWLKFPRASPAPGMAAVYGHHHVAVIESVNLDGTAILYDANSGHHLTRIHRASLAGAIVVNPRGGTINVRAASP